MSEQKFLCQNAARRENRDSLTVLFPARKRYRDVGINFAFQSTLQKTLFPDFSLQRFQRSDFAVAGDQPANVCRNRRKFFIDGGFNPRRSAGRSRAAPGTAKLLDELFDFGTVRMAAQKFFGTSGGKWEEQLENEINGSGGAFDVQQQCANLGSVRRLQA